MAAQLLRVGRLGAFKVERLALLGRPPSANVTSIVNGPPKARKPKADIKDKDERDSMLAYKTTVAFPSKIFVNDTLQVESPVPGEVSPVSGGVGTSVVQTESITANKASSATSGPRAGPSGEGDSSSSSSSSSDSDSDSDNEKVEVKSKPSLPVEKAVHKEPPSKASKDVPKIGSTELLHEVIPEDPKQPVAAVVGHTTQTKSQASAPEAPPEPAHSVTLKASETQGPVELKAAPDVSTANSPRPVAGELVDRGECAHVLAEGQGEELKVETVETVEAVLPKTYEDRPYKNLQHHQYHRYTFVDMEVQMAKYWQPQPSSGRLSPRH